MILAMRVPTGFVRFTNACACLSRTTQVLYSFCKTEVSLRSCTLPWQLGELQEPGPVYFEGPFASAANKQPATNPNNKRCFISEGSQLAYHVAVCAQSRASRVVERRRHIRTAGQQADRSEGRKR